MSMRTRALFVTLIAAGLALAGRAGAHPYGPEYYSFRTVVDLDGADLRITTTVEAPTMKVLEEFARRYAHLDEIGPEQDREFFQTMLADIGAGLRVSIDGKPLEIAWTPADSPINGRADEKFFYYIVTLEAPGALPAGRACELQLDNRAFADREAYYSGWIRPGGGWTVERTNLQALGTAAQAEDVSESKEAWTKDEALRDLRARLAPAADGGSR